MTRVLSVTMITACKVITLVVRNSSIKEKITRMAFYLHDRGCHVGLHVK